jgi:cytochrome c
MSKFLKSTAFFAVMAVSAAPALADGFGLGRPALPEEIAAWNHDVSPSGKDLPIGSGNAINGEEIFADKCAACHGDFAEGIDNWPKLAGGMDTLDRDDPLKTVGSYWPHLTTAFDYIRRSMPYGNAGSLTDDEVYAITAYILYSNDIIDDDFELSNETLLDVEMPNADGFIVDDRATAEYAKWQGEPCMENCKDSPVKVTMRAMVLDVTPQEEGTDEPAAVVQEAAATPQAPAEDTPAEAAAAFDPALAAAGEKVFRKCKACHQLGEGAKNRVGPILTGVVGSAAGSVEGFKYSKVLKGAAEDGLVWTEAELADFIAAPKSYLKGTKMAFNGLKKEEDQIAVIEYLKSVGN